MLKNSLLIPKQLPSFIREDDNYQNFVAFLETYYKWLEQDSNVISESHKIPEYVDIDTTLEKFVEYFYSTFMPAFPKDVVANKRKLLRFSKELYENKGNRAAYKFLFRCLYNVDSEVYETKEYVIKSSSGKWFLPKSVKIKSNDSRWVNAENLFIFGNESKSLAKVERAKLVNDRIEIFISDIQRVFQTGEFIRVVDVNLQTVYFDPQGNIVEEGEILEGKLLGTISSVELNRNSRGNYYLTGDPVVFYNGLENEISDIGASAEVGEVTLGAIQRVKVDNGSWGYREHPNTYIYVTPDSGRPILTVGAVNPANIVNVTMMVVDSLELKENIPLNCNVSSGFPLLNNLNYFFAKTNANSVICNANTIMAEAFTFKDFATYSIDTIIVQNGGGGFRSIPTLSAESVYETDLPYGTGDTYDPRYRTTANAVVSIKSFGILGPIQITTNVSGVKKRGIGYKVGDEILFSGGLGGGAFANVTSVLAGGAIDEVSYYTDLNNPAPLGGFGYSNAELPSLSIKPTETSGDVTNNSNVLVVNSSFITANVLVGQTVSGNGIPINTTVVDFDSNGWVSLSNTSTDTFISNTYSFVGTGADLYVPTVLGDGAQFTPITDRIGAITTIKITNYGEDYVSAPKVSLKVQDIAVTNVSLVNVPQRGDIVYQGANSSSFTYKSYVDSIQRITYDVDSESSTYILRVFNYNKIPNPNLELTLQKTKILEPNTFTINVKSDYIFPKKVLSDGSLQVVGKDGILTYGDGTAKANSKFLSGLILGQGRYIDESHQPSSFSVLEDENYNNFTYVVSVEKEISKYRDILYESMHPAGTKVIGQTVIKSEANSEIELKESTYVNSIGEFEYIWAALATEECVENDFTSELMRFPENKKKYATLQANDSNLLTLSSFPNISISQGIFGTGINWDTKIASINIANSSITLTQNAVSNESNTLLLVMDSWQGNENKFSMPFELINCDTFVGSNVVVVRTTTSNLTSDLIKDQVIIGNTTTIYANTVNNSNLLENVENVGDLIVGQYIYGNNVPNGTTVTEIISGNNCIVMSQPATANANGWTYSYRDRFTGDYVYVYKYNYIQFQSVPYNTKIKSIISSNNTLVLSNNCVKSVNDNFYYVFGEGGNTRDSEVPSQFVRVESGQFMEKYGTVGGARPMPEQNYFVYDEDLLDENGEALLTEDDKNISATIYIRIR